MSADQITGLVLAAGASSRLGAPKQLLTDAAGVPAVARVVRALHAAGVGDVVVVVGAESERVMEALRDDVARVVYHEGWRAGMGSSIAAGVRAIAATTPDTIAADGVLVVPCDMPTVDTVHLAALCARFDGQSRVASSYQDDTGADVLGIPAVLPRRDFAWLTTLDGEQGARPLFRAPGTRTVALRAGAFDLDTPADVHRWRLSHP